MPLAVDVLSDILANPTFDPAELKREQNVIVQEIGASEDNPDDLVFDYLQSTAFPNQPIGRPILGTRETVCSFRDTNLRAYLARNYRAPDMVVAATGAVEHDAVVAEVERRFGQFNGPAAPVPQPARFGGGVKLEARDLEQVHIALALEGLSQRTPTISAFRSSRSCSAAECRRGCSRRCARSAASATRSRRSTSPYADTGMFGIYAGTDAGDVKELMRVAVDETAAAAGNITEAEVNRAKAQIKVGLLMALESSGARARQLANQILTYGRPLPIEEMVARIERVIGRKHARRRCRPDGAGPPGDRGARPRQGA